MCTQLHAKSLEHSCQPLTQEGPIGPLAIQTSATSATRTVSQLRPLLSARWHQWLLFTGAIFCPRRPTQTWPRPPLPTRTHCLECHLFRSRGGLPASSAPHPLHRHTPARTCPACVTDAQLAVTGAVCPFLQLPFTSRVLLPVGAAVGPSRTYGRCPVALIVTVKHFVEHTRMRLRRPDAPRGPSPCRFR